MTKINIMKDGVIIEVDESAVIVPPAPPSTDPNDYPLLPWQFKAMVTYLGKDAEIRTAIDAISDALQKAVALSRYENATSYRHDDAFLQSMRVATGMTEQTLADAWMLAKDLTS